ncbi:MobQ family relaxase [Clostridioides difficile]
MASAAYRAGERLYSSYYGEVSDYTKKGGVIASEIMLPPHAPEIYLDRATLWNAVESCEKHPKAQLAYSFDIAMQNELTLEENMELARKFVQEQFVAKGMIADLAFHNPEKEDGGILNPHFHVMTTMRPLNPDGTWGQKQRREYLLDEDGNRIWDKNGDYMFNAVHTTDWHEPETLEHWREQWTAAVNTKFEEKGLDVRIDHRSYVRQGLDLIPTVHEGANVRQMEAKGIRTEKGELNRWIKATNRLMQDVRKKIKALFVWMAEVKEELSKPQTPSLADLLIAYYNQRNAGAWSNKARTGNLKQFAGAVNYLTENKLLTLEDLQDRLSSVSEEFEALSGSMKKKSARIKELQELIREGENYQRLKPVHTELNNIKFKKQRGKFETSHDAELRLFYAARRILKEKPDGKPIALKAWKQEYAQLKTEYAELSPQHKPLREEVIRLRQVQNAVDTALRRREQPQEVQRKKHEMEL